MDVNHVVLIEKNEEKSIEKDREKFQEKEDRIKRILPSVDRYDDRLKSKCEDALEKLHKVSDINFEDLPEFMKECFVFSHFPLDDDRSIMTRPDWLDMEKFKKGQIFARENFAGIFLGQLYGLLCLICHEDGTKALIMTKKSHTPYAALRRYVSTGERVRNWFTEDPWMDGTKANEDIRTVRRMHFVVRRKLSELGYKEIDALSNIRNPYCPALKIIQKDFGNSMCPASIANRVYSNWFSEFPERPKSINQLDMSFTLFGFMGFVVLYPNEFGIYPKTDEDLENFCHLWRSIAYLLGVNDDANFCRGSLEEVRQRGRDYIEYCVKPSFLNIHQEWEHMSRCIFHGFSYVFVVPSFEIGLLRVADLINIEMPNLRASLSYIDRIRYFLGKYIMCYSLRFAIVRNLANKYINKALDKAAHLDETKKAEIEKKSIKTMLHVSVGT